MRMLQVPCIAVAVSTLAGCSLITDTEPAPSVQLQVDPVVVQRLLILSTGEMVPNRPTMNPSDVLCSIGPERTCSVKEFITVKVANTGSGTLTYNPDCLPPIQRRQEGQWVWLRPITVCSAVGLPNIEIGPGTEIAIEVYLWGSPWYDWRLENEELRVVLNLFTARGDLPLEMRTSESFRVADH